MTNNCSMNPMTKSIHNSIRCNFTKCYKIQSYTNSNFSKRRELYSVYLYCKNEKFAWYIYTRFYTSNGSKANPRIPQNQRTQFLKNIFLKNISLRLAFKMLNKTIIRHLTKYALIDLFEKIKKEKCFKSYDKSILMCIMIYFLDKNIEQISVADFYFLIEGELVTMLGHETILNEIKTTFTGWRK